MKRLMQNGPFLFQTEDLHTFVRFQGNASIEGIESYVTVGEETLDLKVSQTGEIFTYGLPQNLKGIVGDNIGGSIWLSTLGMLLWLTNNREIFAGKSVLELGCGLALPAQFISKHCSPAPAAIAACDHNLDIILQSLVTNDNHSVLAVHYDWEQSDLSDSLGRYDVVIACDVLYRNTAPYVLSTVQRCLLPGGMFILINPLRQMMDQWIYGLQAMFDEVLCKNFDLKEKIEVQGSIRDLTTELMILVGKKGQGDENEHEEGEENKNEKQEAHQKSIPSLLHLNMPL